MIRRNPGAICILSDARLSSVSRADTLLDHLGVSLQALAGDELNDLRYRDLRARAALRRSAQGQAPSSEHAPSRPVTGRGGGIYHHSASCRPTHCRRIVLLRPGQEIRQRDRYDARGCGTRCETDRAEGVSARPGGVAPSKRLRRQLASIRFPTRGEDGSRGLGHRHHKLSRRQRASLLIRSSLIRLRTTFHRDLEHSPS